MPAQPDAPPKNTPKQAADIVTDVEAECFCQDAIEDVTADVTARFDIRRASGICDYLLRNLPPSYGKAKPLSPTTNSFVVPAQPDAPPKKTIKTGCGYCNGYGDQVHLRLMGVLIQ